MSVSPSGLAAWLALNRLPGLGGARFRTLIDCFDNPLQIFSLDDSGLQPLPAALRQGLLQARSSQAPLWAQVCADQDWLAAHPAVSVVTWADAEYPSLLREIPDPPPLLFVRGDVRVLQRPQLAVIGSRRASSVGVETAFAFARNMAASGLTVTSGLARGIDAAAHRGALQAEGFTVAVMATGPDRCYPPEHRDLAEAIVDTGGALVTEFPPGTQPLPGLFPRRNRLISGLSMGVLVVEATLKSGSLVTARLAMEQGREVFAIPGSIHRVQSRGCHRLIREGATLTGTVDDIFAELGGFRHWREAEPVNAMEHPRWQSLLDSLDFAPTPVDVLVARSALPVAELMAALTELELEGWVMQEKGGYSRCLPGSDSG